jgi:hypothetical protein
MALPVRRFLCAALLIGGLFAPPIALADTWGDLIVSSPTLPITAGYLCQGAGSIEVGCPTTAPYLTSGGLLGLGITPTVALEVSGTVSATRFVGDGSGLTGLTATSSDRISTSGVSSGANLGMAVADKGTISFTLAGTAGAAYLHGTLGFVGPGVSTTGAISGTNAYFANDVGIGTSSPNTALVVSANNTSTWNQAITLNSYDNGTGMVGGGLRLASMRGTAATPTNTLYGDQIGSVNFSGYWTGKANAYFGQNESRVSIIARASEDWNSSANTGTFLTFNTTGNGSGSSYERMRIDASGNIGIGTKAPAVPLDVSGAIKVAGDGAESCTDATVGIIRRNPVTGHLEACH